MWACQVAVTVDGVQVEISCSARIPSPSGRQMDSTPFFTAPSLKFTMGVGAAPSGITLLAVLFLSELVAASCYHKVMPLSSLHKYSCCWFFSATKATTL